MAPPAGFDTEQIRAKARKDLLYLLSVVSKAPQACHPSRRLSISRCALFPHGGWQ